MQRCFFLGHSGNQTPPFDQALLYQVKQKSLSFFSFKGLIINLGSSQIFFLLVLKCTAKNHSNIFCTEKCKLRIKVNITDIPMRNRRCQDTSQPRSEKHQRQDSTWLKANLCLCVWQYVASAILATHSHLYTFAATEDSSTINQTGVYAHRWTIAAFTEQRADNFPCMLQLLSTHAKTNLSPWTV